jgi:hypothetical protein
MSPRAAWRLESIGFTSVYEYAAGKADWGSFGRPLEGTQGSETRVGAYLRRDVPTYSFEERSHSSPSAHPKASAPAP